MEYERIVHTSTSEYMGLRSGFPLTKLIPFRGQSPYSASKVGADKLAESFYCTYDLPVVAIRPCYMRSRVNLPEL